MGLDVGREQDWRQDNQLGGPGGLANAVRTSVLSTPRYLHRLSPHMLIMASCFSVEALAPGEGLLGPVDIHTSFLVFLEDNFEACTSKVSLRGPSGLGPSCPQ